MYELVDSETREGEGYRNSATECCRFALSVDDFADTTFEIWQVADDDAHTRMCLVATITIPANVTATV